VTASPEFIAYVIDQLAPCAQVAARRMFGGAGLYAHGLFFGLISSDTLYFKVDDSNRADFVARRCEPFQPIVRNQVVYSMSYFQVPADILEDVDELKIWARKALAVAAASKGKRRKKKRIADGG
jgi:DNA transformation protein